MKNKINNNLVSWKKKSYHVDHQKTLNVQPSDLKLYNNLTFMLVVKTVPTLSRVRSATPSLFSVDFYNFRINIKDFLHSLPSSIFNKHSATYCIKQRPNLK